jgi:VanZ family protein
MLGFGFTTLPSTICAFVSTNVIEFFQYFIPGRVSDLRDVALNISGAFITGVLISRKTNTHSL